MAMAPVLEGPSRDPREAVAAAIALLQGLHGRVDGLPDADLVGLTRELEGLGRTVDALRVRAAGEVDARSDLNAPERLSAAYGCRHGFELLERLTHASSKAVRERVALDQRTRPRAALSGEELPAPHPEVAAALEDGRLGIETARLISGMLARVQHRADPAHLTAAEAWLVERATSTEDPQTFEQMRIQTTTLEVALDQDGPEPAAEEAAKRRSFTIGPERNGIHIVSGGATPELAGLLQLLFDTHGNPAVRFGRHPEDKAPDEPWAPGDAIPDPRTPTQKRHDVLLAALQAAVRAEETPSLGGAAPTLLVHVALDDLTSPTGVASIDGISTPVPASLAQRIACTGAVQKVVFDRAGRIVRLGSKERVFNAHQRKAIAARDGGCIIPGCTVRAAWCEIHHVADHAKGGPTHTDNGVMLCWWHHRNLERSGWGIRMNRGRPEVRAPLWIDPRGLWRPTPGTLARSRARTPARQLAPPG